MPHLTAESGGTTSTHTPSGPGLPRNPLCPSPRPTGSGALKSAGSRLFNLFVLQTRKLRLGEGRALPRARRWDGQPGGTRGESQAMTEQKQPECPRAGGVETSHSQSTMNTREPGKCWCGTESGGLWTPICQLSAWPSPGDACYNTDKP